MIRKTAHRYTPMSGWVIYRWPIIMSLFFAGAIAMFAMCEKFKVACGFIFL